MEWNEVVTPARLQKNHDISAKHSVMFFFYTEQVLHSFPDYNESALEAF